MIGVRRVVKIAEAVGLTTSVKKTGSPDWVRVFIMGPDGLTLGRASIQLGKYEGMKWYYEEQGDIGEPDRYIHSWRRVQRGGPPIEHDEFACLVAEAEALAAADYRDKQLWRKKNPRSGRPPLKGRSVRAFLYDITTGAASITKRPTPPRGEHDDE